MHLTERQSGLLHGPGEIVLDPGARTVSVDGEPIMLTRLAFDLLATLLHHRGEVLTYEDLATLAWGQQSIGEHGAILTAVYRLRMALNQAGATDVIRAVRGVGYTIDGPRSDVPELFERSALESVFRQSPSPSMMVTLGGQVRGANDAAARLFGMRVTMLERLPSWTGVLAQGSWSNAVRPFAAAAEGQTPAPFTALAIGPGTGETQIVRVTLTPIDGQLAQLGVLVTVAPVGQPMRRATPENDRGDQSDRAPADRSGDLGRAARPPGAPVSPLRVEVDRAARA